MDNSNSSDAEPSTSGASDKQNNSNSPTLQEREDEWRTVSPAVQWVQSQLERGINPRSILDHLLPPSVQLDPELLGDDTALLRLVVELLSQPPKRQKLPEYNTLDDAVQLIRRSKRILVLTGAGVSVSCGIPDFRSANGIYARLSKDFPELPNPQAMFDIHYFKHNQRPFFDFAKEIYPGQFKPSLVHRFIQALEQNGKLLANYTQNIDTLEQVAGIKHVVHCHGSFATASCTNCKRKVSCEEIREDIFNKKIPMCSVCTTSDGNNVLFVDKTKEAIPVAKLPPDIQQNGPLEDSHNKRPDTREKSPNDRSDLAVMKPDIVFFGEALTDEFHDRITVDKDRVDLLIIIGSSMKVRPVALIPSSIPPNVPQLLINMTELRHMCCDIELLGKADQIVEQLCLRLGEPYSNLVGGSTVEQLHEITELPEIEANMPPPIDNTDGEPSSKRARLTESADHSEVQPKAESTDNSDQRATPVDPEVVRLRAMYRPKHRNVGANVPSDSYLFVKPNRYLFPGAEVYRNLDDDGDAASSVSSDNSSSSSGSLTEENSDQDDYSTKSEPISPSNDFENLRKRTTELGRNSAPPC